MNILVLGSGGREHAIAWKLSQSSQMEKLYVAPGNAGTSTIATNVNLDLNDFKAIGEFALENAIQIIVVGPEQPLVDGIADFFDAETRYENITIIGPNKKAAQLEGSKDFSKKFMKKYNIPTAKFATITAETIEDGFTFLDKMKAPYVLKADGLAAGKGVLIIQEKKEAKAALKEMLSGKFGAASKTVVIEQFLKGIELSCFIITDGKNYKILPSAKDYKRIGEGDTGLNTGGMGAISPVPFANDEFLDKVENQVIIPTIKGLRAEGISYVGFIFFGIINVKNDPYVIEYNCRMGDPETEVVMPRLKSDLVELFDGIATDTLSERDVEFDPRSAATVMMVSGGYPEEYKKGKKINGLDLISSENTVVFHAGTKMNDNDVVSNGGRVLAVTSYGKDFNSALDRSYTEIENINFEGAYFRKDLGFDLEKTPQQA